MANVGDSPLNSENDPLRGQKNTLYEGGTRVLAFANWPGKLTPQKYTTPMHVADWMLIIADLVEYVPTTDLHWDGINQWHVLTGATPNPEPRTICVAMKGSHSICHDDWKLIVPGKGKPQLFNIADDPYEKTDMAVSKHDVVSELRTLFTVKQSKDQPKLPADLAGLPESTEN